MKRIVLAAAFVAALSLPARADEGARLAVWQATDVATTAVFSCQPNTFERDPLARAVGAGKCGQVLPMALTAVALNFVIRRVFRHAPVALKIGTAVEQFATFNNLRVIAR